MHAFSLPIRSVALFSILAGSLHAQASPAITTRVDRPQKRATAVRVPSGAIRLDGRLDDAAWTSIPPLVDFVQKDPIEGAAPTDQLEIRIAYDNEALYVATRVRSKDPSKIQAPMSRRDNIRQAEHIWISLDTYRDRRTAYSFAVTASGVRGDWYHSRDNEYDYDTSFDPVWQAAAAIDATGWTSEMRIPFSQLRFNAADDQEWGINFDYWSPSKNENVFWIPVPKKETGWSSWMGTLTGIRGIRPTRRVEILPYVASNSTVNDNRNLRNPFDDGRNVKSRLGGDLKMGVGPNLTLEATVNPDFGQVEADPAEVNLSAFETFFSEKRPFFLEGDRILRGNGGNYYYSRRIGARPRGAAPGDFVDYPQASTIMTAAKLTGQLAGRTSLGVLGAVTGREYARTFDSTTSRISDTLVAPVTGYGVARASQQFGANQSTVGGMLTGVTRDIHNGSPLSRVYNTRAITGGGDWNLRFKGGAYSFGGFAGFSHVAGDARQISNLQRSSALLPASRRTVISLRFHAHVAPGRDRLRVLRESDGQALALRHGSRLRVTRLRAERSRPSEHRGWKEFVRERDLPRDHTRQTLSRLLRRAGAGQRVELRQRAAVRNHSERRRDDVPEFLEPESHRLARFPGAGRTTHARRPADGHAVLQRRHRQPVECVVVEDALAGARLLWHG